MSENGTHKSGQPGVSWDNTNQHWNVNIVTDGKNYRLGRFPVDQLDAAIAMRKEAEKLTPAQFPALKARYGFRVTVEPTRLPPPQRSSESTLRHADPGRPGRRQGVCRGMPCRRARGARCTRGRTEGKRRLERGGGGHAAACGQSGHGAGSVGLCLAIRERAGRT